MPISISMRCVSSCEARRRRRSKASPSPSATGSVTVYDRHVTAPKSDNEDAQAMFVAPGSVEDDFPLPRLDDIVRVTVSGLSEIVRVLLISGSTHIFLDRLRYLRDKFNVETPLVTEHSGFHMRSPLMAARRDGEQDKYIADHPGVVAALKRRAYHAGERVGLLHRCRRPPFRVARTARAFGRTRGAVHDPAGGDEQCWLRHRQGDRAAFDARGHRRLSSPSRAAQHSGCGR